MVDRTKFRMIIQDIKESIPQIIDIKSTSMSGYISIKKVMDYLQISSDQPLSITDKDEILMSIASGGVQLSILDGNKIKLPSYIIDKLGITGKSKVCFIHRPNAVAIKRLEVEIVESIYPKIIDKETPTAVIRQLETFGDPIVLYEELKSKKDNYSLKLDVGTYWKNKTTFIAWKTRQILNTPLESDNDLQIDLIQERLNSQSENGSWKNKLPLTAKILQELSHLGLDSNHPKIQKAIQWIIEQPQSPHNPGMFFLNEELVQKQLDIIEERNEITSGPRPRFRNRVKSEINLISEVDELYYNPCGQRIMWANAIVIEALLMYGYEFHDRIQTALDTLAFGTWCECRYQHGKSSWDKQHSLTLNEIEDLYSKTMQEFKHGGIADTSYISNFQGQSYWIRISDKKISNGNEYELRMPMPNQGCEYITVNAMARVQNDRIQRIVEAHLWRFIVLFYNALRQPNMAIELEFYSLTKYFQLRVLAKYDSLPAKLGILLALPWIIENQNEDGTWGALKYRESATLAVIEALKRIEFI
jgi:hypothetical protein